MQLIEEFMRKYFDERIAEEKREQASRAPFRQKYHTEDCYWDSRAGTLEMMQSEKVLQVTSSGGTAEVITSRKCLSIKDGLHHLRYHLQQRVDVWLIHSVDLWCFSCRGESGQQNCIFCHGTGWLDSKLPRLPQPDVSPFRGPSRGRL